MQGFTIDGVIERVTDGDTIRVQSGDHLLKLRILGLDTEESNGGSPKPVTNWGKEATRFATEILPSSSPVIVEFPGDSPFLIGDKINSAYLDNFERPLGFLHLTEPVDGLTDLTEIMIRKGFSPYFVKYGRAVFENHDRRYAAAEIAAQRDDVGVWNQLAANGVANEAFAPRNYAQLGVWWELRARVIDNYRAQKRAAPAAPLFNTRLDYDALVEKAEAQETVTVFMELRDGVVVGGEHFAFRTGSQAQPFQLFLPEADRPQIREVLNLAANRYVADGEAFPRRNYAYVTGPLKLFRDLPEMVVETADQIGDAAPGVA